MCLSGLHYINIDLEYNIIAASKVLKTKKGKRRRARPFLEHASTFHLDHNGLIY